MSLLALDVQVAKQEIIKARHVVFFGKNYCPQKSLPEQNNLVYLLSVKVMFIIIKDI